MIKVYVLMMFFSAPVPSYYGNVLPVVVDNLASYEQCAHIVKEALNNKHARNKFESYVCIEAWKAKP